MVFADIEARIALLMEQVVDNPENTHELHEQIHEKLNELKATGMPLPQDLVDLERHLEAQFLKREGISRPAGRN